MMTSVREDSEPGAGVRGRPSTSSRRKPKAHTQQEQVHLLERVKTGDQAARHELVMGNEALVCKLVRSARVIRPGAFPEFADYLQEALLVLFIKCHEWDPNLGSFSTWAAFWIRGAVLRMYRANVSLVQTGFESIRVHTERATRDATSDKERKRRDASRRALLAMRMLSLDAPVASLRNDGPTTFADVLADASPTPEELTLEADLAEKVRGAAERLPCNVREVVLSRMRGEPMPDIAARMGYTRQRIQQLEAEAVPKIRKALWP